MHAEPLRVPDRDVELLERLAGARAALLEQVGHRIVGQREVLEGILTAVVSGGHALLLGVPGLAKTLMVSTIAESLALKFARIQFTPDLMPSDITGTDVIEEDPNTRRREIRFIPGSIFSKNSIGTNILIKSGAKVVTSVDDILEELNLTDLKINKNTKEEESLTNEEKIILNIIEKEPIHIDKICHASKMSASQALSIVSILEIKGMIKNIGGGKFVKFK